MSGFRAIMPPRSAPLPERPPVENWTIMPGQCLRSPSSRRANFSGSEVVEPSSLRTWQWARVAPASKASWVDSTCSATVIGTAGLFSFFGTEPVMATVITQGVVIAGSFLLLAYASLQKPAKLVEIYAERKPWSSRNAASKAPCPARSGIAGTRFCTSAAAIASADASADSGRNRGHFSRSSKAAKPTPGL